MVFGSESLKIIIWLLIGGPNMTPRGRQKGQHELTALISACQNIKVVLALEVPNCFVSEQASLIKHHFLLSLGVF